MANKLTPEEAVEVIRKGLKKCLDSAFALHNEFVYDSSFDMHNNEFIACIAGVADKMRGAITNALNYFRKNDLTNLAEDLHGIAILADVGLETVKLGTSKTKYADFLKKTIPHFEHIKEEIKVLQDICKQLAK